MPGGKRRDGMNRQGNIRRRDVFERGSSSMQIFAWIVNVIDSRASINRDLRLQGVCTRMYVALVVSPVGTPLLGRRFSGLDPGLRTQGSRFYHCSNDA